MKEMRRVLALFLCMVMLIGVLPVGALATEGEPAEPVVVEAGLDPNGGEVKTDGDTSEDEVKTDGSTSEDEVKTDGNTSEDEVKTDGSTSEDEVKTDGNTSEDEVKTDGNTSEDEVKTDGNTSEDEVKTDGNTSEDEVKTDGDASEDEVKTDGESSEDEVKTDDAASDDEESIEGENTEEAEESIVEEPVEEIYEVEALYAEIVTGADPIPVALISERTTPSKAEVKDALDEARTYIDSITVNNSSNDPATVVGNFGTHFSWDNEKRENGKSYLFDWSYYNGVVFEGLEYLYEVTGDSQYRNYVVEYMSSLIASDGTWAKCANNSSKTAAGYVDYHGADCYKTASLLLDTYAMTGDDRYLTMAATLYADLDAAAEKYLLSNAGNNYHHTWASASSPNLWLDGLYMIMPFQAEYAARTGDTAELQAIVDRLTWVSNNMYNSSSGLFYHAANSATSNSGTYWLRSIGWYAAAIADVMDSVSASQRATLAAQLTKLVDGLEPYRNEYGMWLNNLASSESSGNPYETSGTALVCYAVMKAVNNGWIDDSYAERALTALVGICNNKLANNNLTDICFKGAPGSSNSTFYDNEGKGLGPFIMLTAEVQEYYNEVLGLPTMTGITVSEGDAYYTGETLAPVVTASYDDGSTKTVTDYTVEGEYDMNAAGTYTVTVKVGEFTAEYTFTVAVATIPENGTLTGLKVTTYPALKHFVSDEALNITGMVVAATFEEEGKSFDVQIPWAETSPDGTGYSVTYEPALTTVGEKTVTVKYTYGDVTLTDTFIVTVYNKIVTNAAEGSEEATVTVETNLPGVSAVTVAESSDTIQTAAAELAKDAVYVAYDITLTNDYTEDENDQLSFKVTMPLPEGEGKAQVWYIPTAADEEPEQMTDAVDNGNGTVTFTTTHFSDYVAFYSEETVAGEDELVGGITYTLDTNGVTANKNYLIVNSSNNGTGYALTNNSGAAERTQVTISGQTITVENDANIAWVFSGNNTYTVGNNGRYVYPNRNSLSLNTNGTNMTVSSQGNGAYRIYRGPSDSYYYYLRYNNNAWTGSRTEQTRNIGTVYLYEYTSTASGGTVNFTLPESVTVQKAYNADLAGTVTTTIAGVEATVELSDCEIEWEPVDSSIASVDDGVVTGLAQGETQVMATLSAVNGTELKNPIKLTVTVNVYEKTVVGEPELSGLTGEVIRGCADTASTGAYITVQYDDGTDAEIDVTVDMLSGSFDTTEEDIYTGLTVTYNGKVLTNAFTLTVNPKPGNNYPEYPNEGSVNVNKRADDTNLLDAGVVKVELTTSGIPIKTGVNVLLIMDISNSMSWDDSDYDYADQAVVAGTNQRLNISKASAKEFSDTLLAPYEDGTPTNNTLTLLAFAGIDGDYNTHSTAKANDDVYQLGDLCMTTDAQVEAAIDQMVKATTGGTNYDYAFQQAYSLAEQIREENDYPLYIVFMTDGVPTHYNGVYYKNRSNTDLTALMQYVDPTTGATSDYTSTGNDRVGNDIDATANQNITVYYNNGTTATKNVTYNKGWSDYVTGNKNGWAEKVKTLDYLEKIYSIGFGMKNGSVTQGAESSMPTLNNVNGGQYYIPSSVTRTTLEHISTSPEDYYEADNTEELTALYKSLAAQIRQAATNAYFVDQMGDSFNLQIASSVLKRDLDDKLHFTSLEDICNVTPAIQILNYNIYTKADAEAGLCREADIGKRYGDPIVMETVTFTDNAAELATDDIDDALQTITVTGATSTKKSGECLGKDGVIYGEYFYYNTTSNAVPLTLTDGSTYSLPAETFYWNIGTINNIEWAMTYYAYLAGSMEGNTSAGNYATNNYATLYYDNWLGNNAFKPTTSPVVGWESANVKYAFYLVDENGNPVVNQTTGQTGNFQNAVKITQPVLWEEILLNNLENINTIEAKSANILPYGYDLYDETATYKIVILSEGGVGAWTITHDASLGENTTYVTGFSGSEYTNETHVTGEAGNPSDEYVHKPGYGYTGTTVWFAVVWVPKTVPDAVVIDYGLPVDISVLANDQFGENGSVIGIGTVDEMNTVLEGAVNEEYTKYTSVDSELFDDDTLTLNYGTAKMTGQKVRYTPTTMEWSKAGANSYDKFAYEVKYDVKEYDEGVEIGDSEDDQYYYGEVTVIPATTVYYEDTYTNGVTSEYMTFKAISTADFTTEIKDKWEVVGTTVDATQAEDRPGQYSLPEIDANNVYGYDGAYAGSNMSMYSLGSAHKITVDSTVNGVVEFSFYGTGFDLISLTDNTSGTIFADIIGETNGVEEFFVVDNYYGYSYQMVESTDENGVTTTGYQWVITDSADPNAIYQVPVMKVEGLPYGKYNITLTAAYDKIFDHGQAVAGSGIGGSYDLYVDAIRIYDPAGESATDLSDVVFEGATDDKDVTIADIYEMDKEGWPQYVEVRNQLISEDTYKTAAGSDTYKGAIFIDGVAANYSVSDYTNFGPNNEVYLAPGQAVAFELDLSTYIVEKTVEDKNGNDTTVKQNIVADVQLGVKSATGEPVTVKLTTDTSTSGTGSVTTDASRSFNTSTDMYYSFSAMLDLGAKLGENGSYEESNDSKTIVTIKNDGSDGIVSITNVKVTFSEQPTAVAPIMSWSLRSGSRAVMMMSAAPSVEIDPTEPEVTEPETSVPEETVPETTVPEETEPETTVPEETEPEETVPEETEPSREEVVKETVKKVVETAVKVITNIFNSLFGRWF